MSVSFLTFRTLLASLTCAGCRVADHVLCAGCRGPVCLGMLSDHQRLRESRRPQFCMRCLYSAKVAA